MAVVRCFGFGSKFFFFKFFFFSTFFFIHFFFFRFNNFAVGRCDLMAVAWRFGSDSNNFFSKFFSFKIFLFQFNNFAVFWWQQQNFQKNFFSFFSVTNHKLLHFASFCFILPLQILLITWPLGQPPAERPGIPKGRSPFGHNVTT